MRERKSKQRIEDENILWGFFTECASIPKFWHWWEAVYPTIEKLREEKRKNPCNYSVLTFALYELTSGQTAKKVAIGSVAEWLEDKVKVDFWFHLRNICREGYEKLLPYEDKAFFMGMGVECLGGLPIWNFYLGTKNCEIYAVKCLAGKMTEFKHYRYDKEHDTMFVDGKAHRTQVNIELEGEKAKKFLKWLRDKGYINAIYPQALALLDYLSLDTVSASAKRGVALYFE